MTVLDLQVSAGADDGYFNGTAFDNSAAFISFGKVSTTIRVSWIRFTGVTVASGDTVDVATLSFATSATVSTTTVNANIRGVAEDNAATITSASDWNARTSTSAQTAWNNIGAWTLDTWYSAPDAAAPTQEIIDRAGWASGNALLYRVFDNSSSTDARRSPYSYDGSTTFAPKLHIEYTPVVTTSASDTQAVSVTETAATAATSAATDTQAVSVVETSAITAAITASDTQALSASETGRIVPQAASRARPQPSDLIRVNIYPPLGKDPRYRLDYDDINPSTTAVSWRSGPGGWTDASVGIAHPLADERYGQPLAYPYLRRAMHQQPFAHIEIKRGPYVVFAGRIGAIQRTGNTVTGFGVTGYGLAATRDNPYSNTSTTTSTSGIVLESMIASIAPHLRAASGDDWYDPAVAHAPEDFHLMELADALDQVVSEGDTAGNLMDWWVYEDQRVVLKARSEPTTPDYHLANDEHVVWVEDPEWLIGAVTHQRTASGTVTTSSTWDIDPDFVGEHGFERSAVLQLGEVTDAVALALRQTYLRLHSTPFLSGSIELGPDDALTGPGGAARSKETARYGQWVQIGREALLMIVSTDYDATAGVLRMEAGQFMPSFETLVAVFQQDRLRRQRRLTSYAGRAR